MIRALALAALFVAPTADAACTVYGTHSTGSAEFWLPDGPSTEPHLIAAVDGVFAGFDEDVRLDASVKPMRPSFRGQTCDWVDVSGSVVTPGFIDVGVQLGLVEVSAEDRSRHADAGGDPVRAAFRVADGYDPLSTLVPITRVAGVTSAVVLPSGGRVAGQAAWVQLEGRRQAEAWREPSVGMSVSLDGPSEAAALSELRELLGEARDFQRSAAAWSARDPRGSVATAADLEALQPVLKGEQPLIVSADRAATIEGLVRFAEDEGVKVVLVGGAEAWLVADLLASASIPVVVDAFVYGAGSFDQVHGLADNAALLAEAGVSVVVSSNWTHNSRLLPQLAGNAVRGGLPREDAIAAVTSAPAAAFGLDGGRIAAGAPADLVVWGGDPLELGTPVQHVVIGGVEVPLKSRHTELMERYRELPGSPVPPLELP